MENTNYLIKQMHQGLALKLDNVVAAIEESAGSGMQTHPDLSTAPSAPGWYLIVDRGELWEFTSAGRWESTHRHSVMAQPALVLGSALAAPNINQYLTLPSSVGAGLEVIRVTNISLRVQVSEPNDIDENWTLFLERGLTHIVIWSWDSSTMAVNEDNFFNADLNTVTPALLRLRPVSSGSPGILRFSAGLRYRIVVIPA